MSEPVLSWRDWPSVTYPTLNDGGIHVLAFDLDLPDARIQRLAATLSRVERDRAGRFVRARDRQRYVVRRGVLREVLASVLQTRPDGFGFAHGVHGKPRLTPGFPAIEFNASHSGDVGAIALSAGKPVGIDLEQYRQAFDWRAVARVMFEDEQYRQLESLPNEAQLPSFYGCWSRNEAFLKATGTGWSEGVAFQRWWTADLPAGPGIAASVVCESAPRTLTVNRWRER